MKTVVFYGALDFRLEDKPVPKVGPSDVLIRVKSCGICGSDAHIYKGSYHADFPVVLGHEYAGVVEDVGGKVTKFRPGDRVCVEPNVTCGKCPPCQRGENHLCTGLTPLGITLDGGFAEYSLSPETQVYRLPEGVTFDEGAMAEPIACCLRGIHQAEVSPGDLVVVMGAGVIGCIMIQLAKLSGAGKVVASDPLANRLKIAAALGADVTMDPTACDVEKAVRELKPEGADAIIDCAGLTETAQVAIRTARRGGRIVLFGVCPPDQTLPLSPYIIMENELTIRGSFNNPYTQGRAVELLGSRRLDVRPLITHRMRLEEMSKAFEVFGGSDVMKIMMDPDL